MKKLCLLITMLIIGLNLWPSDIADLTYKKLGTDSTGKMLLMLYSEDSTIYVDNVITVTGNQIVEDYSHQMRFKTVYDTIQVDSGYARDWFSSLHLRTVVKAYQTPHRFMTWKVENTSDKTYDWSLFRVYYDVTTFKGSAMIGLLNGPYLSETVIIENDPREEVNVSLIIAVLFLIAAIIIIWGDLENRILRWEAAAKKTRIKWRGAVRWFLFGMGIITIISGIISFIILIFIGFRVLLSLAIIIALVGVVLNYIDNKKLKAN